MLTEWSDSWRRAFRVELRAEAIGLAARGWPVLPGTYPVGDSWAGRDGTEDTGPVPVHRDWPQRIGTQTEQVATWWTGKPYSLLCATGIVVDALEVDADLGNRTAKVLRAVGVPVPIIATPDGTWLFPTLSGSTLDGQLAERGAVLHGAGSWIPFPPTPYQHGVVHWRVKPEVCAWRLPTSDTVQVAMIQAAREAEIFPLVSAIVR